MENGGLTKNQFEATGHLLIRYGLVLVIGWIGAMKFTNYEAHSIEPMVAHSPVMGWMYKLLSVQTFSNLLGIVGIAVASLIALRPFSPKLSSIGSASAVLMFLTAVSFLFSTPGWKPSLGGFPALSALPGQFLLNDVVLLGAAVSTFGEAARIPIAENLSVEWKWITNASQISPRPPRSEAKE
jgi:uncharacterized membrane protein YkgB